jgi:hypothetical protein
MAVSSVTNATTHAPNPISGLSGGSSRAVATTPIPYSSSTTLAMRAAIPNPPVALGRKPDVLSLNVMRSSSAVVVAFALRTYGENRHRSAVVDLEQGDIARCAERGDQLPEKLHGGMKVVTGERSRFERGNA